MPYALVGVAFSRAAAVSVTAACCWPGTPTGWWPCRGRQGCRSGATPGLHAVGRRWARARGTWRASDVSKLCVPAHEGEPCTCSAAHYSNSILAAVPDTCRPMTPSVLRGSVAATRTACCQAPVTLKLTQVVVFTCVDSYGQHGGEEAGVEAVEAEEVGRNADCGTRVGKQDGSDRTSRVLEANDLSCTLLQMKGAVWVQGRATEGTSVGAGTLGLRAKHVSPRDALRAADVCVLSGKRLDTPSCTEIACLGCLRTVQSFACRDFTHCQQSAW